MKYEQNIDGKFFCIGELINKFESLEDNSVRQFNQMFGESIGGCQERQVEIFEPFTHMGRILSIDNGPKFQFLFKDETSGCTDGVAYDLYNNRNEFVQRYRKIKTIARDYQVDSSNILTWFGDDFNNKHKVRVEKINLNTGKKIKLRLVGRKLVEI
jgi:hypothetical protein